jgi:hypothetical protein
MEVCTASIFRANQISKSELHMEKFVTNIGQDRDQREQRTEGKLSLKKDGLCTSGETGESGKNSGIS